MTRMTLTRIAPWPAARILAVLYLVIGIIIMPFMLIAAIVGTDTAPGGRAAGLLMAFLMPFIYAFVGLMSGLIGGGLYNLFARMLGGIPLEFAPDSEPAMASTAPFGGTAPPESPARGSYE